MKNERNFLKRFYCRLEGEIDGGGGGNGDPSSSVDPAVSSGYAEIGQTFLSQVPEQYRNEQFVHDLVKTEDPQTALWSKFAGMEAALKTQPAGMPAIDASAEDWAKWTATVAPKDVSVYGDIKPEIAETQAHLTELLDPVYSPEIVNTVLDAARQLGVQPFQMKGLMDTFNKLQVGAAEEYYNSRVEEKQHLDKQFDDLCAKQFGKDREKIIGEGFDFLAKNAPPELVGPLNTASNEALAAVAYMAYNLKQKYESEDRIPSATGGVAYGSGNDVVSLKSAIGEKMSSDEYKNSFHAKHAQTVREVQQLSSQLARLTKPREGY